MFYREAGQFKTNYAADMAILPMREERNLLIAIALVAFLIVPFVIDDYWTNSILLPFLVYVLAALGLNILVGYCGQISLGTGGFLAVGAYSCYKLTTAFPEINLIFIILASGVVTAAVGVLFGLPSLRIKGFYLAVATLAAQFFITWLVNKVQWFNNYSATGQINMPPREVLGITVTGPAAPSWAKYLLCLAFVAVFALAAKNLSRARIGRAWMAVRDMDIAAELIGIRPFVTKLSAFAVSSFYIGMAGALMFGLWLGGAEAGDAFGINQSFLVLFMVIIGGLGTILGPFLGAAFLSILPIFLKNVLVDEFNLHTVTAKHAEIMIVGVLIVFFLIAEPHGLARLWQITREKLKLWPFPY